MSKRKSGNQANTLLNYFSSPKTKSNQNGSEVTGDTSEKKVDLNDDSDMEPIASHSRKRRRFMLGSAFDDEQSEEEIPVKKESSNTDSEMEQIALHSRKRRCAIKLDSAFDDENDEPTDCSESDYSESEPSDSEQSEEEIPVKKKSSKAALQSFSFKKSAQTKKKAEDGTSSKSVAANDNEGVRWLHEKLDFLKPNRIRDINKYKPNHPDYDARTLYVPEDYLNKLTPAMRQWWVLKSRHMDTVLFFKVGKFYELYHMDAVIGVNNLGFSYMKGEFAHSGFPESAYGRMASSLIEQGFKVARVEQTETPEMMAERCKTKKATKFDKVVSREICEVSTKGMCVYGAQLTDAKHPLPSYMLAIAEKKTSDVCSRYGVCFVDCSIGVFYLAEFDDDLHCSKLLALLVQHPPALILTERNRLSTRSSDVLKKHLGNIRRDQLTSESQFYSADTTVQNLMQACYFVDKNYDFHWPPVLKDLMCYGTFKPEYELAIKALGACTWYLKDSELDIKVLSMGRFEMYNPVNTTSKSEDMDKRSFMVLDAITLQNLRLLGGAGSLQKTLDHCQTAFGKRELQKWICRPLCDIQRISERQTAIKELINSPEKLQQIRAILKKLPDLERQIAKIHIFGNRFCAKHHPDSRAVLYENKTYSKRKIHDLLSALRGFEQSQEIASLFQDCDSHFLLNLTQHKPAGRFVDLSKTLQYFKNAFDQSEAEKEGKIIPQAGIDEDYDRAEMHIAEINHKLQQYLEVQRNIFGCQVTYFGSDRRRFQLEIMESKCHKVTNEYQLESTKKGSKPCKRYSTPTTKELLAKMMKAEFERAKIIQDLNRRIFEKFSERYDEWDNNIQNLKVLDVLCALAEYARIYSQDICLPEILPFSEKPITNIENGRHPCITNIENFIPNDTIVGTEEHPNILVLTGPNMGGKSTLMRQVALISIMAQIGSYVPASSCKIGLIDRIFTRIGAQDNILKHQSTFLVEMMEAAAILQHATKYSFVLLDELGRGTSTHDGNAIATAYVQKLIEINCRTIFSTHYHSLVEHFVGSKDIQLGHMACMVEDRNSEDVTQENITFLYKLSEGACPESYGFNVAKLAGLPRNIIRRAAEIASKLEAIAKKRRAFAKVFSSDKTSVREALLSLA